MAFNIPNVVIQHISSPVSLTFNGNNTTTINFPVNLNSLRIQRGTLTANDVNTDPTKTGDGFIQRGETVNHDGPGGSTPTLLDPTPDLTNATVLGVGQMGGLLSGILVQYPVILVSSGGRQYLLYPTNPDLLTLITGTINTTVTFFPNGQIGPGGGFQPCFARGTLILTDNGQKAVEDLCEGDLIQTADNGLQPIRWIGGSRISAAELAEKENLRPIRIRQGALGDQSPSLDLVVSPQHRVLVRSKIAQKMFGTDEVLVAAKQLCQLDGIDVAVDLAEVEYFHILFDRHEVVFSNGAETETLFTGPEALRGVGKAALEEILTIFPQLRDMDYAPVPARAMASGRMGRKLVFRHAQSAKELVQ